MRNKSFIIYLLVISLGVLAWGKTLNFWFFKAYEATWLMGLTPHNFVNLVKGHGFLYFLNLKIFGWNPMGWYLVSLILHILASLLLFQLILRLSKNIILAGVTGLIFVANTSYNDVLTWGSFNSYYPLLFIFFLLTLLFFYKFKETGKKTFLVFSLATAFLGFFTRETGIMIVPLIALFDLVFFTPKLEKKAVFSFFKEQIGFWLLLLVFLILNHWYKGTSGDFADSMVKMRIRFIKDGLFLEYGKWAFLTFGKLIPPQIIPYPILNWGREFLYRFIYSPLLDSYFFPILGWIFFVILSFALYSLRKFKKHFKLFLFFWFWLGLFTIFTSLVVPNTQEVLVRAYDWNTMRYRYFAFGGMAILLSILLAILYEKRRKFLAFSIVFAIVIANLLFLWRIEDQIYASAFKPGKEFYTQFKKEFPTLSEDVVFYIYPHAPSLNDYLLEWYYLKDSQYPNLAGQPYRVESQIEAILNKVKLGKINLKDVVFLDYSQKDGLSNKTKQAKDLILGQKTYSLDFKRIKTDSLNFSTNNFVGPPVELPYNLEIKMRASLGHFTVGSKPDSERFKALVDYNLAKKNYLEKVKVSTSPTMSQRAEEPFFHVAPQNLIDGNFGPRSSWIADAIPAWLIVDLGEEKDISTVAWGSPNNLTRTPATYSLFVSSNALDWNEVKNVKNNTKVSVIDIFEKSVKSRYVKMVIYTTSLGDFALLDEFEVIEAKNKNILKFYQDRDELIKDSLNMFGWAKLTWETNKPPSEGIPQSLYFPYLTDGQNHTLSLKLKEAEIYAGPGQFLEKYLTSISLDFGKVPFNVEIKSAKLVPRYEIKNP